MEYEQDLRCRLGHWVMHHVDYAYTEDPDVAITASGVTTSASASIKKNLVVIAAAREHALFTIRRDRECVPSSLSR
jgi:hypothetical protein